MKYDTQHDRWVIDSNLNFGDGYIFLGGYNFGEYDYLIAFNNHTFNLNDPKKILKRYIINLNTSQIRSYPEIKLSDEGSMLQSIDTLNHNLLISTYWDGYLYSFNIQNKTKFLFSERSQADVIKTVNMNNRYYTLFECLGSPGRAQLLMAGPEAQNIRHLGLLPTWVSQKCNRITAICSDDSFVYF